jgi:threonine synthase
MAQNEIPPDASTLTNDGGLDLLDGATGELSIARVADAVAEQRLIAADPSRSIEERIDAYEDITDCEVGDTNLTRARNLEREVGIRQLFLKFEGGNPTGTQKDRISFAQAKDALRRGFDTVTIATCGNYGAAMALATSLAGLRCIIYIPENYRTKRTEEMVALGAEIVRVHGDYETAVLAARERADREGLYDANPGGSNSTLQMRAYGGIANEIYDELRDAPAAVALPVSNGSTAAGTYRGFLSLFRRGKTSRMPRIVVGSSYGKNPIVRAFVKNLLVCEDLPPEAIKETQINEPLINWHSIDGDEALDGIRSTGGWAADASDKEMLSFAKMLREREGLSVLPASTAGLVALLHAHQKTPLPGDRYVVVLTGRK